MKHIPAILDFSLTLETLLHNPEVKSAVFYMTPKQVIKFTWHNKPKANNRGESAVMSFGAPNYRERAKIKKIIKDSGSLTPFIDTVPWPVKKKPKKG